MKIMGFRSFGCEIAREITMSARISLYLIAFDLFLLMPASSIAEDFTIISDLPVVGGWHRTTSPMASLSGAANSIEIMSVTVNGQLSDWSQSDGTWSIDNIPLNPGINCIIVQAFDSPDGTGALVEQGHLDVWYDTGFTNDYPQSKKGESSSTPDTDNSNLRFIVRDSYLPDVPVLVRVEVLNNDGAVNRDMWDAVATLSVTDNPDIILSTNQVLLYNGLGSALVTFTGSGPFTLTVNVNGHEASKVMADWSYKPVHEVSGRLARGQTWSGVYHITGEDFTIPAGVVLTLSPGTLVLIDGVSSGSGGADIDVQGAIQSLGTADSPVTITAYKAGENWGELHHADAELSTFRYTNITQAGHSPRVGHSNSGPAIRASNSDFLFDYASLADNAGKLMHVTSGSDLTFYNCLFARSVMGPEISRTALWFENSWITDMHADDDADGIYIHGQQAGQQCTLLRCVAANIDDDGIDTLNSDVTIHDCIVRDCKDKGISVYGGEVDINYCLIVENNKAPEDPTVATIATKTVNGATAVVNIDHSTIVTSKTPGVLDIGIQSHNKYGVTSGTIVYNISNSIIDASDPIDVQAPYLESDIEIEYSNIFDEIWPGTGNISADPMFVDPVSHNYRLKIDSPSIDAGDPAADLDPDMTITDQGYNWQAPVELDLSNGSLISDNRSEHIVARGIPADGWFIVENNFFGRTPGHNDAIDLDGSSRPDPVPQIMYNFFAGGGDDALDFGSDAHIEGNIFKNYIKDEYNKASGESNVISAGAGKNYVMVRNIFHNFDHIAQVKDDSFLTFENNTVVNTLNTAIYFDLGLPGRFPGRGAYLDGNIFWETPIVFEGISDTTDLTVNHSLLSAEWHDFGVGNIDADPLFVEGHDDFALKTNSPPIGAGPCGLDMGALVPEGAAICGEPDQLTSRTEVTLFVGGPGITHYKYRLEDGPWSQERPVDVPIQLNNLRDGESYFVQVVGKNSAGVWQSLNNPTTSRIWKVDLSLSSPDKGHVQ